MTENQKMEILNKWDKKIRDMCRKYHISGMDFEDIYQEMRIVVLNASEKYDEKKGVSFNTYLHRSIVNRAINLLDSRAVKFNRLVFDIPELVYLTSCYEDYDDSSLEHVLPIGNLSETEIRYAELLVEGRYRHEIEKDLGLSQREYYYIRDNLRQKCKFLLEGS